jgi:integrase/recombinase XerD
MATIKIVLRKKQNKDGTFPLALRITKDRKSSFIHLGYHLFDRDWDEKKSQIKKSHPNSVRLNNLLATKLAEASNTSIELETNGSHMSSLSVKEKIKPQYESTFFGQAEAYLNNLKQSGKYNQFTPDNSRLKHFKSFLKNQDILLQDITVALLDRYKIFLKTEFEISERTIINHLVVIRSVFSHAIMYDPKIKEYYPFGKGKIKIKFPDSIKIGLSPQEVKQLETLELAIDSTEHHARNLWLFSFYLAGMRISDVLRLKWSDIQNNRLHYSMGKNQKGGSLKLPEKAITILEFYSREKTSESDYIFPELKKTDTNTSKFVLQRTIAFATSRLDKFLNKNVAKEMNLKKPLTMHIARHTFGNISGDKIPIQMLQKLYRHSSIITTIGYQSNFIHKDADEALEAVINL